MNETIRFGIQRCISYFLLRGYGWQTRRMSAAGTHRREWQDPRSGQWYGAPKAMMILQDQMFELYADSAKCRRHYTLRC
jgi:hypothetical protein